MPGPHLGRGQAPDGDVGEVEEAAGEDEDGAGAGEINFGRQRCGGEIRVRYVVDQGGANVADYF